MRLIILFIVMHNVKQIFTGNINLWYQLCKVREGKVVTSMLKAGGERRLIKAAFAVTLGYFPITFQFSDISLNTDFLSWI